MAADLTDVRFGDAHEGRHVTGMGAETNVRVWTPHRIQGGA
jgi:hypothetical protein